MPYVLSGGILDLSRQERELDEKEVNLQEAERELEQRDKELQHAILQLQALKERSMFSSQPQVMLTNGTLVAASAAAVWSGVALGF